MTYDANSTKNPVATFLHVPKNSKVQLLGLAQFDCSFLSFHKKIVVTCCYMLFPQEISDDEPSTGLLKTKNTPTINRF